MLSPLLCVYSRTYNRRLLKLGCPSLLLYYSTNYRASLLTECTKYSAILCAYLHLISCNIWCIIRTMEKEANFMPLCYKVDVLAALKEKGYNTNKIRTEGLLSQSTLQKFRNHVICHDVLTVLCDPQEHLQHRGCRNRFRGIVVPDNRLNPLFWDIDFCGFWNYLQDLGSASAVPCDEPF